VTCATWWNPPHTPHVCEWNMAERPSHTRPSHRRDRGVSHRLRQSHHMFRKLHCQRNASAQGGWMLVKGRRKPRCGGQVEVEVVGFGGAAGGEISHFFSLSKSPRGETSKNSGCLGTYWDDQTSKLGSRATGSQAHKQVARPATCLLVLPLPLRMSLSFSFLAAWEHDGAPPGHLCAFCASVLWFGRAARFVCAHSYVNVKTPVLVWALFRGFSWFFPSRSPLRLPLQRRHLCAISHTSMR